MKKHTGSMIAYLNMATKTAVDAHPSVYHVEHIDATKIVPNEKNFYSIEGIEEMANSLAVSDHMAPLEVIANGDGTYRLISGERRLSATLFRMRRGEIDKAELPCHVLPAFEAKGALSAEQVEMLSIIFANNYRQKTVLDQLNEVKQLEPIARAIYQEAKEKGELTDETGANIRFRTFFAEHILSISKSALQRLQALERLTDAAKKAFSDGLIGKSVATELAALPEDDQRVFVEGVQKGDFAGTIAELQSLHSHDEEEHLISPMKETTVWEEPCTEETILEEVEGQNRLPLAEDVEETDEVVTEIETSSFAQLNSNEGYGEYMTIEDAAKILMNLQTEFEKDGRHREGIALKKACTALYEWRNRHET